MVVDTISRNVLGECESLVQAKALFLDLVSYAPSAATEIVILSKSGKRKPVSKDEIEAALAAAAA